MTEMGQIEQYSSSVTSQWVELGGEAETDLEGFDVVPAGSLGEETPGLIVDSR